MLSLGSGLTSTSTTGGRKILPLKLITATTTIGPKTLIAGG